MRRRTVALILLLLVGPSLCASIARADGDPGSDVLVYQPLFLSAHANVPVNQQLALGRLLSACRHNGFPIRVAIISSRADLGAITGLWHRPRAYARFLGLELSQAYSGRLLVVMPNGFGFNWPGHSANAAYRRLGSVLIGRGGGGLANEAQAAVRALVAEAGVSLTPEHGGKPATGAQPSAGAAQPSTTGSRTDELVAEIAGALAAAALLALLTRRLLARRLPARRSARLSGWAASFVAPPRRSHCPVRPLSF